MLARHRQSLILQAVRSDGSARVSDLTQQLGVSDMTIRRDLEVLARDGLVEKVHGGAVLPGSHNSHEPSLEDRLVLERGVAAFDLVHARHERGLRLEQRHGCLRAAAHVAHRPSGPAVATLRRPRPGPPRQGGSDETLPDLPERA